MRMNPRNIALLVGLIIIMVVLIVLGNRGGFGGSTPTETPAVVVESGSLLPEDLNQEELATFEIRELPQTPDPDATEEPTETPNPLLPTATGTAPTPVPEGTAQTVMRKNGDGFWVITDDTTYTTDRGVDQVTVTGTVGIVAGLDYAERFSLEETGSDASAFGLDEPQYEIVLASSEEEYRILLGNKNPSNTRYYVQLADNTDTVYLVVSDILDNVVNYIEQPPYVPPPTATPTATRTPNPYSEVEQTQTAEVEIAVTQTALATQFGTALPTVGIGIVTEEAVETEAATEEVMETEETVETEAATEEPTEEVIETEEAE